ncbi:type VII secretion protein EccCb [Catenuloplanes atrovinosus]|uniref:S-DNA-T family DNA segregation ATPase FtsK/SpoIIIE n=1 Tax=Catenuloplanes atrovinosus TaxID=137266 RepID=A0AAE3YHV4_9ACTN|nr:type VII secretion protein EccCb [Catenuloplanes atrovinosus]MDR7274223.1 S-DNA-T family DNA segregation ATPase FtsK/SpoIIIE [Catenuloplanes atrovinosus]
MSRISFHRPARFLPPAAPQDKVVLPAPPEQKQSNAGFISLLLPLLSSLGIAAYMVSYGRPMLIALAIIFAVVSFSATIAFRVQNKHLERRTVMRQRARYRALLMDVRTNARQVASTQRMLGAWAHPEPDRLLAIAHSGRRVWERRQGDPDFLRVRIGLGDAELSTPIQIGTRLDPLADYDWESMRAARRLVDSMSKVAAQPIAIDLGTAGVVSVLGAPADTAALTRAMLCQLAVMHAPDDVLVAIEAPDVTEWEWAKWLPHTFEPGSRRRGRAVPLVSTEHGGLADVLDRELRRRSDAAGARRLQTAFDRGAAPEQQRLVVVFTAFDPVSEWGRSPQLRALLEAAGPQLGITLIFLGRRESQEPGRVDLRVSVAAGGGLSLTGRTGGAVTSELSQQDRVSTPMAELIARKLTPLTLTDEQEQVLARTVSLIETLLNGRALDSSLGGLWEPQLGPDRLLRVPIGTDGDGQSVVLDIKESAQGGSGPHGLIVGATGSGKSELLRTLVAGLMVTHSPELLSLVVVDFKGGATFAPLAGMPHVAGMITNLADDAMLIDRVRSALAGEQQRRQQLLRLAGNVDSIREYQRRRLAGERGADGAPLPPMPYLLVIIDEFAELLSAHPEFVDLFVQIGRVGRSLGIHLLFSTQRLEEGRLRGLDSHLSYRICLRTFSAQESRTVIGTQDAYRLPPIPGSAYLKVDETIYRRFRVAHVSAPFVSPEERDADGAAPTSILPYEMRGLTAADLYEEDEEDAPMPSGDGPTELSVIVDRLSGRGTPARQVWLPPLPRAVPLDVLLGPIAVQSGRGLSATMWPAAGELRIPVGVVDLPAQQAQEPLLLDLGGPHGNLAIVGAPRSGRSTLLRTLMLATVLTHTPAEAQFYCIDFGGETLHPFTAAPHVGDVAGRMDREMVGRMLADIRALIAGREKLFRELGIDSVAEFRARRDSGRLPDGLRAADVFLIVDNWGALRTELDTLEPVMIEIASRGLGVGVHLILTTNRWMEIRPALRESIGTRLELRLNDYNESDIHRRMAQAMPSNLPGRLLCPPGVYGHVVLPRLDGRDTDEGVRDAQQDILAKIGPSWHGKPAPRVRMLPESIVRDDLDANGIAPTAVPIGIGEPDIATVGLDLVEGDPHFVVFGDTASGKSTFLRTWLRNLIDRQTGWEARVVLIDYRRSLLGIVPEGHLGAYAADAQTTKVYAAQIAGKLRERMPPATVTPEELKARSWWEGPEIYVVIDDYDLVGGGMQSPLAPLVEFIPHARDIGFHVVLARRVAGAGRGAVGDVFLSRVRDLGGGGLLLSGDSREGQLLGTEKPATRPAGRGALVSRGRPTRLVQIALDEAAEPAEPDAAVSAR